MLSSTYTHTKPYLPVDELSVINSNQEHILSLSSTGFQTLLQPSGSFSPFIQILQELLSLTTEIRNLRGVRPSDNEMLSFTARRPLIEWVFSTLLSDPNSEDAELENCAIENCCRLATLFDKRILPLKSDEPFPTNPPHLYNSCSTPTLQQSSPRYPPHLDPDPLLTTISPPPAPSPSSRFLRPKSRTFGPVHSSHFHQPQPQSISAIFSPIGAEHCATAAPSHLHL